MDFHKGLKNVRARFGDLVGSGDGYSSIVRRRVLRRWAIGLSVIAGFVVIGYVGYSLGSSQIGDADTAYQAGSIVGEQRGAAVGAREGYRSAFKPARERAYDAAYSEAYRAAYLAAFERADLAAPRLVKVSGP